MAAPFALRSTAQPQPAPPPVLSGVAPLPLAPGWTEHLAPTGHTYYYNASTKTSTYNRPIAAPVIPVPEPAFDLPSNTQYTPAPESFPFNNNRPPKQQHIPKPDKPKTKRQIPGSSWCLMTTKKGFRFVHNLETKESLWEPPEDVMALLDGMAKMTIQEEREAERIRRRKKALERAQAQPYKQNEDEDDMMEPEDVEPVSEEVVVGTKRPIPTHEPVDEYEEGDYDDEDDYSDAEHDSKRVKTGDAVEFDEDDIAYQLAGMAEEYGLEDEDFEDNGELPAEDAALIFKEMLDEYGVNPYATWEKEMPKFVEDGRYTVLPNTKTRKVVFSDWSRTKMADIKKEKEKMVKVDPRIAFLDFLESNATSKLYWTEFKRKFKKIPEMKDAKVTDKEREKYYRDYVARMKISVETKENDLKKLLQTTKGLRRGTTVETLPVGVSCDIRYVSLSREGRERILEEFVRTLPDELDEEDEIEKERREEEQRKAMAIEDRERAVRREQGRLKWEAERGKEVLRGSEREIERAMKVGKEGLMSHLTLEEVEKET